MVPSREEIAKLPRWARVAFAARCARQVLPVYEGWAKSRQMCDHLAAVRLAVEKAECSAALANTSEGIRVAVSNADSAAFDPAVVNDTSARAAADSAAAAASSAAYASATAFSTASVAAVVRAVISAAAANPGINFQFDFEVLCGKCRASSADDNTQIPPAVFDTDTYILLPRNGNVTPANDQRLSIEPSQLILQVIADEGVTADTVRRHLVELYEKLNNYSMARYGTYLTRDGFRRLVFQGTGVAVK